MKINGFKRIAIGALIAWCLIFQNMIVYTEVLSESNNIVAPTNIIIVTASNSLKVLNSGKLSCVGVTITPISYTASVKVELQYINGVTWETVLVFSQEGNGSAVVDEHCNPPEGGGRYRLKITHRAYDSNENLIEEIIKYSDEVTV